MSFKSSLVKTAIKLTPNFIIVWIANILLKGIAELTDFNFDIDTRTVFVEVLLAGEAAPLEVSIDGFSVVSEGTSHYLMIHKTQSNRLWMDNLLARIAGKAWKIPVVPEFKNEIELIVELFKAETEVV
ncbi:MAG: hypothetical protein ACU837_02095 [Gammaproteobacteria bacterium]